MITGKDGVPHVAEGALGPERQWLRVPGAGPLEGTMEVMDEDGLTPLGRKEVKLVPGKVYHLQFERPVPPNS